MSNNKHSVVDIEKAFFHAFNENYFKDGVQQEAILLALRAIRPYLRTTEPVCPYIVTSPETAEGDGGTSYCRLAEAPKPVSVALEKCVEATYGHLCGEYECKCEPREIAKAVLDAAGVKYAD